MSAALKAWFGLLIALAMLDCWAVETGLTHAQRVSAGKTQTHSSEEVLSQPSRFQRSQWGLNETEWQRYLTLMQGIRGSISQANLSPLEVLGIHAETDETRRDYAHRLATVMHEDAERVQAFIRVYSEEVNRLYPANTLIDNAQLGQAVTATPQVSLQPGDRVLFFARLADCADCDHQLKRVLTATAKPGIQLDIYLVNATHDNAIRAWAQQQPLDPVRLKNKTITLNHDQGTLTRLAGPTATVPLTIRLRGPDVSVLDPLHLT